MQKQGQLLPKARRRRGATTRLSPGTMLPPPLPPPLPTPLTPRRIGRMAVPLMMVAVLMLLLLLLLLLVVQSASVGPVLHA